MSDTFPDLTKAEPGDDVAPATFDLDAWIDGSKPTERSVTLVGRGDLVAEAEAVLRRYEVAKQIPEGDRGITDDTPASLEARLEELYAEMEASRSTWYLHALRPEEQDAARKAAEEAAAEGKTPEYTAYLIAAAVSRIVRPDGATVQSVTPDQVLRIRATLGDNEVVRLVHALSLAMNEEPKIQAPFSRTSSPDHAGRVS
jgi:hypothetical protein